jgi:hypothetical protein
LLQQRHALKALPIDDAQRKRVEAAARQRPEPSCSITWSRFGRLNGAKRQGLHSLLSDPDRG